MLFVNDREGRLEVAFGAGTQDMKKPTQEQVEQAVT
jgi:hypothetical protein